MNSCWQWAVVTNRGIYSGETEGTMEPGETQEEAMKIVEVSAIGFVRAMHPDDMLVCCFVTRDMLSIMPLMEMDAEEKVGMGVVYVMEEMNNNASD